MPKTDEWIIIIIIHLIFAYVGFTNISTWLLEQDLLPGISAYIVGPILGILSIYIILFLIALPFLFMESKINKKKKK